MAEGTTTFLDLRLSYSESPISSRLKTRSWI
jgi:hypothetical protein